eukprot:1152767-Pelagomonas_calceolata.AAC.1
MGRKPLGLPASGKVTPGCPGPPRAPPFLKVWLPSQTKLLGSPAVAGAVRGAWEAVAGAVETFATSFAGGSWPEPAYHPARNSTCRPSKTCYRGSQVLVAWGAAGKVWKQRFHKVLV